MSQQKTSTFNLITWGLLLLGLFSLVTAVSQVVAVGMHSPEGTVQEIAVIPDDGPRGAEVTLYGTGYVPGSYVGTIRWDGVDVATFTIPSGGDFMIPFTIPSDASPGTHIITICSGSPCFTNPEFEQIDSDDYTVIEYDVFVPMVVRP